MAGPPSSGRTTLLAEGVNAEVVNRHGSAIARGHPIGASAAIALVRALADLEATPAGSLGLAAAAGAGGLGSAGLVQRAR